MMKHSLALGLIATLCLAGVASAQTMKPGLWAVSSQIQMDGEMGKKMEQAQQQMQKAQEQMKAQMDAMPPEQRKMIQDAMAKQGMGSGITGNGSSMKMCVTKEMTERNEMPLQQGKCQQTASRSGNTIKVHFSCTDPAATGDGVFTVDNAESSSGTLTVKGIHEGKPVQMQMSSKSKWLSADCGDVKPIQIPKK